MVLPSREAPGAAAFSFNATTRRRDDAFALRSFPESSHRPQERIVEQRSQDAKFGSQLSRLPARSLIVIGAWHHFSEAWSLFHPGRSVSRRRPGSSRTGSAPGPRLSPGRRAFSFVSADFSE